MHFTQESHQGPHFLVPTRKCYRKSYQHPFLLVLGTYVDCFFQTLGQTIKLSCALKICGILYESGFQTKNHEVKDNFTFLKEEEKKLMVVNKH